MHLRQCIAIVISAQMILAACSPARFGVPEPTKSTAPASGTAAPPPAPAAPATETPVPIARVTSADRALFNGDYESAIAQYEAAATSTDDASLRAAALWGLARSLYSNRQFEDAVNRAEELIASYPDSSYAAPAQFLLGQSLAAQGRPAESAAAYADYIIARPGVLDSYASQLRGDALAKAADHAGALDAYKSAQASPHLDDAQALQIKIAQSHAELGENETAISLYHEIAATTTNDYVRAQMDYLAAQAHLAADQPAEANERLQHAVENYPTSYYSYLGLVQLLEAGIDVSDIDRGLTDYYAGAYDKALEALERYVADNPANDGTAYYYRAASLDQLQQYQEALDAYTGFVRDYSGHDKWSAAWFEKSTIEWFNLSRYPEGAATLVEYVGLAPTAPDAPDALFAAARILERDGRFDDAAALWQRLGDEYSTHEQASTALLFAGIMQYRQADYPAALSLFDRSLVLATTTEDQARAQLWVGKAREKQGNLTEAQHAWQLSQAADPGGYYSERAADLLNGRAPFTPAAQTNMDFDLTAERSAADAWMRLTFNLPSETDLSGLDTLAADPRLIRGRELWNLGLYDEARLELEDLRGSISGDAVLTYRLANFLLELGLYRSGITAARQVLTLAGMQDQQSSMLAPPYFNHVRYGLYYRELIIPAAEANGLDPLLLFSVIRQESLFEGFVSSSAGARGLMQIVPATGADISRQVGWPIDFDPSDLYRPNVSVSYGSHYLANNRRLLQGDIYAALAAYNGGPGNAVEWLQLSQGDADLFVETVRAQESRDYIRRIYEIYIIYRRLYSSAP